MFSIPKTLLLASVLSATTFALEPSEILVVANRDIPQSMQIAEYYCQKRKVPRDNVLALLLGKNLNDTINRERYEKNLVEPLRKKLAQYTFPNRIRCLLTIYGVPIKVGGRGPAAGQENKLPEMEKSARQLKQKIEAAKQNNSAASTSKEKALRRELARLQSQIDRITGKETDASVDSELSMVLFNDYELYRWQRNELRGNLFELGLNTLMVSRLDGPGADIVNGLIDKAIKAEKTGLDGTVYIDSRGIRKSNEPYSLGYYDKSLRGLAVLAEFRTDMHVKHERTDKLFGPGECTRTALYCGWYSLKKYIDAFDFVDGAIGYHISSLEAVDLRDANSLQWCPAMLKDGITATIGAVAEPYLHSFPQPRAFFLELFNGRCLVEAYYRTKPFNSWRLVLVGDPLYTPFETVK